MALRKIELMYNQFGKTEGHACRECSNLEKMFVGNRSVTKCKVYGCAQSEASDWAGRYLACGLFNKPWNGKPVMQLVTKARAERTDDNEPLEGQMSLEV